MNTKKSWRDRLGSHPHLPNIQDAMHEAPGGRPATGLDIGEDFEKKPNGTR